MPRLEVVDYREDTNSETEWKTLRVWGKTYQMAKVLAAYQGVSMGKLLHELLEKEVTHRKIRTQRVS